MLVKWCCKNTQKRRGTSRRTGPFGGDQAFDALLCQSLPLSLCTSQYSCLSRVAQSSRRRINDSALVPQMAAFSLFFMMLVIMHSSFHVFSTNHLVSPQSHGAVKLARLGSHTYMQVAMHKDRGCHVSRASSWSSPNHSLSSKRKDE